ncbi:hypothetical protein [Bacillus sp. P14.5]|uniref:hypothetical protein n=1 Tax=Bacillus sp. P14.5 TaxID=1983400 RepID=UPI000DE88A0F|nr:hypothetical protein [Bacillus sp. P14.5]
MRKFIEYHLGICKYYLDKDLTGSLDTLRNILSDKDHQYFQEDVETLIAIANILSEEKHLEESEEYYLKALELLGNRPADSNYQQKLRLYYNYQRFLKNTEKYSKAVEYANKGIRVCILHETLYLHGEFYFYKGVSLIKLKETKKGIESLQKAMDIFTIAEKEKFKEAAQKLIKNYS